MGSNKKIVAFHLFNDFSGSPKVLKMALEALAGDGYDITMFTSDGGVLDSLKEHPRIRKRTIRYRFSSNPLVTVWRLVRSQSVAFFKALRHCRGDNTITYINTILPFGAALGARLAGSKIIYHYHENAFAKGRMYRMLASLMTHIADEIICVSDSQKSYLPNTNGSSVQVIPNAISSSLETNLNPAPDLAFKRQSVLMLSSLKEYKGTCEFIRLASQMPHLKWCMVINAPQTEIDSYLEEKGIDTASIPQLQIHPRQTDICKFYNEASIVVSLTNPDMFVETFGLTAAEAMSAGLPVIVPTVGGIADLVTDGYNGYRLDVRELSAIRAKIDEILTDRELFLHLAVGAIEKSQEFSERTFSSAICKVFDHIIESTDD